MYTLFSMKYVYVNSSIWIRILSYDILQSKLLNMEYVCSSRWHTYTLQYEIRTLEYDIPTLSCNIHMSCWRAYVFHIEEYTGMSSCRAYVIQIEEYTLKCAIREHTYFTLKSIRIRISYWRVHTYFIFKGICMSYICHTRVYVFHIEEHTYTYCILKSIRMLFKMTNSRLHRGWH